jgi:hypothetical protein
LVVVEEMARLTLFLEHLSLMPQAAVVAAMMLLVVTEEVLM